MDFGPALDVFYLLGSLSMSGIGSPACTANPQTLRVDETAWSTAGRLEPSAAFTAFVDVTVVPMDTERLLPNQTVLIENGRIAMIGPATKVEVPVGATRIDGRGKYLIPGLADMHVHFASADSAPMARQLFDWLADGVTTVRSMDYTTLEKGEAALRIRALAGAGKLWSPRLYVAGPWAPRNRRYMRPGTTEPTLDSVASYVAEYKAKGFDHIKLYWERGAVFDSLIAAAHREGIPIGGHVLFTTLAQAFSAPLKSIEHFSGYIPLSNRSDSVGDTTNYRTLAAETKRAGVWNTPTLAMASRMDKLGMAARHSLMRALQQADAGLLLGTDHASIGAELEAFVAAGLTPYQTLVAGTRNAATFYGTVSESGTIAVGKRADLVLLNGNPLQDIRHAKQPAGVMLGGRWLPREEIDRHSAD